MEPRPKRRAMMPRRVTLAIGNGGMLQLKNVTKQYGETTAVDGVTLSLPKAQTYVLIGPSGCGKSTVLRLFNGLIQPDAGEVLLDGQRLTAAKRNEVRKRCGYVIQEGGLFPHLSALDNVRLIAKYHRWDELRISTRLNELTELTKFPVEGLQRRPDELSGGQRQRVSLMRALMLDPNILLLDEPLGALDPMIRSELQRDLKAIFSRLDKTVVLVTHDLNEAAFFGDSLILMRLARSSSKGRLEILPHAPLRLSLANSWGPRAATLKRVFNDSVPYLSVRADFGGGGTVIWTQSQCSHWLKEVH